MTAVYAANDIAREAKMMSIIPLREHIPIGRQNAISRSELAWLWKMSDREVRDVIAKMRTTPSDDKYAILSSSSNPAGYWRSNDPRELEQFIKETQARAKNTLAVLEDVRRVLACA